MQLCQHLKGGETEAAREEVKRQICLRSYCQLQLCMLAKQFHTLPSLPSKVGNSLTLGALRTTVSQVLGAPNTNEERRREKREKKPEAGKRANPQPTRGKSWNWYHVAIWRSYGSFTYIIRASQQTGRKVLLYPFFR